MPRLFVSNLHFEQQLAGDRQHLPLTLQQRAAEQACGWLAVAQRGDVIWCPLRSPDAFWEQMSALGLPCVAGVDTPTEVPSGLELNPWGWSENMLRWARTVGAQCDAPSAPAVRQANSRRFSLELEQRWNVGIDGAVVVTSQAELATALCDIPVNQRWVAKAEFSAAARQRIVCTGPQPDRNSVGWLQRRLDTDHWLVLEPWVERVAEAGLQWTVPQMGTPVLEGVTELLTDSSGQYVGSRFGLGVAAVQSWQAAIEVARVAVAEIQRTGYFGPVGIDAMRYRAADGSEQVRPLQDINARWTMGRLALGWQRVTPSGVWRYGTTEEVSERLQLDPRIIRTSPDTVGGQKAQTATWLEPADSAAANSERYPGQPRNG